MQFQIRSKHSEFLHRLNICERSRRGTPSVNIGNKVGGVRWREIHKRGIDRSDFLPDPDGPFGVEPVHEEQIDVSSEPQLRTRLGDDR
jgi:hypothetical protein